MPTPTESWPDATGTVPLVHFVQAFTEAAFRHDHFNAVREVALTGSRAAFVASHSVSNRRLALMVTGPDQQLAKAM
jgi:hypothetical protein